MLTGNSFSNRCAIKITFAHIREKSEGIIEFQTLQRNTYSKTPPHPYVHSILPSNFLFSLSHTHTPSTQHFRSIKQIQIHILLFWIPAHIGSGGCFLNVGSYTKSQVLSSFLNNLCLTTFCSFNCNNAGVILMP